VSQWTASICTQRLCFIGEVSHFILFEGQTVNMYTQFKRQNLRCYCVDKVCGIPVSVSFASGGALVSDRFFISFVIPNVDMLTHEFA